MQCTETETLAAALALKSSGQVRLVHGGDTWAHYPPDADVRTDLHKDCIDSFH